MQILIHARDYAATSAMRDFIKRKLGFGVGRFADRIARINIRLKDMNGPRGGVDQHCRVDVAMSSGGTVAAEATELDIYTAIKLAVARVARRVGTTIDRRRSAKTRRISYPSRNEQRYDVDQDRVYESGRWNEGVS